MKALVGLVLTALVSMTTVAAQANDWKKIRIATEGAYAPWNFTDASGKLVGFELDLGRELCKRMNAECEVIAQAWDGIIPALQAGKYDVIMAGMSITEKRQKVITFSRSYAATPAKFVVLSDSEFAGFSTPLELLQLDDVNDEEKATLANVVKAFKGRTIGVQTSTTHENFLRAYFGDHVDIRTYDTQENLDLDVQAGRVDAALAAMSYWVPLLKTDKGKQFKMVGPGMTGGPFGAGVGVGLRKANQDLADKFSAAIESVLADGTCSKMAVEWFGFDACAAQ